ncbi:MAG: hypothetical protein P4L31_05670 [Candidatus Babeliales bacterium]|nr:hypothetical protein [Candidatus Babeliales bacterium]
MNAVKKSLFLISIFSFGVAWSAKEPTITCNNYNQHTIIQSIAGKDGVRLQNVTIGRTQAEKDHAQDSQSSNEYSDQNDSDRLSPTHSWTNENAQHITLNAQSTRTQLDPLLPDEIIPDGIVLLARQSTNVTSYIYTSLRFLGITIGIAYTALVAKLLYDSQVMLKKSDTWASWKQDVPDNVLLTVEVNIAKELYTDIQARYADQQDTAAFLTPLVHFINDVDAQIHQLKQFIKLHETLAYYKIALLFPAQQEALTQAAQKINRLQILKQFMVKSISQYKVAHD